MKLDKMKKSSIKDLHKFVIEQREEIAKLTRDNLVTPESNVRKIRGMRKDIARALTIINQPTGEDNE